MATKSTKQEDLKAIDSTVLALVQGLTAAAATEATGSVERILAVSATFLSKEDHAALKTFHDLYFGGAQEEAQAMNDDVDRLVEEAQAAMARGEDVDAAVGSADTTGEQARLGLSALQKQLETIIATQESLRDRLAPILSGMQFEDATRQRLEHLSSAWELVVKALGRSKKDYSGVANAIAKTLSSNAERQLFYSLVLRETPPESVEESAALLFDLSA